MRITLGFTIFIFCIFSSVFAQNQTDAEGLKQGHWHIIVPEKYGEEGYQEDGYFKDGKKEGVWYNLSTMGDTLAIEQYKFGNKNGVSRYYDLEGLIRKESWLAHNPKQEYDTIEVYDINDPNKIELKRVKIEGTTVKHGTWVYYYPGGKMIKRKEEYVLGNLKSDAPLANKTTKTVVSDTTTTKKKIIPKEVLQYEKDNSGKKKIKVRTGNTGY